MRTSIFELLKHVDLLEIYNDHLEKTVFLKDNMTYIDH